MHLFEREPSIKTNLKFGRGHLKAASVLLASLALVACGGGGGGAAPAATITPTPAPTTTTSVSGTLIVNGVEAPATNRSQSATSDRPESNTENDSGLLVGQGIISLNAEFKADGRASLQDIIDRHPDLIIEVKDEVTPQGPFLVTFSNGDSSASTRQALDVLQSDPAVLAAEPVVLKQVKAAGILEPNDPDYAQQKNALTMIGMPTAWATTVGKSSVCVAVLDSGFFTTHEDLSANFLPGWDFVDNDSDPTEPDAENHGTHVAGTVGARGNNRIGGTGVAWKSRIVPLRIIGAGQNGLESVKAIRWAAGLPVTGTTANANVCKVINMSIGNIAKGRCTETKSTAEQDAVNAAEAAGVVVVAAAGNEGQDCPAPQSSSPANLINVISVAAVTMSGERAKFSNAASHNWIAAPGGSLTGALEDDIYSSSFQGPNGNTRRSAYKHLSGTSMASPHVAGVVALMFSVNPNLTPAQVRDILSTTADDKGTTGRDDLFGFGIIRADKAVQAAGNTSPPTGAQLATVPNSVQLSGTQTVGKIIVSNRGDQNVPVTYQSAAVTITTGGNWLTSSLPSSGATAPFDITLTANRANLEPGIYRARVEVTTSASRVVVPVSLVVPGTPDIGTITVKLLNPDTKAVVASTTTNAAANYRYSITGFPAGNYLVRADSDTAGVLLGYEGNYPLLSEAKPTALSGTETLAGFPVTRATSPRSISSITGKSSPITSGILAGVYDTTYGDPIANATISITGGASAQTDINGEAAFAGVSGAVTITASAPGYSTQTFVDINSETIEFELDQAGTFGVPVNLTVSVDGLVPGETGYVSAIVDGDFEDLAVVTSANPSAILSIPSGRELSIGLLANNANNVATKFEVEDFEPIYQDSAVTIDATAVTATASTSSIFTGFGPFTNAGGETHAAIALAYDDAGTSYIIGARFNVPIGQRFDLSRVSLGSELDDTIAGQIVYLADDSALTLGSSTTYTVYNTLSGLPTSPNTSVSGKLPQASTLSAPMDNATVSTSPTLQFSSAVREITPSLLAVTIEGPDEFLWEIILPPTATSFELPTLSGGGLAAGTAYTWYVEDYVLDGFSYDNFSFEFGDFFDYNTESVTRSFKTAL